MKADGEYVSQRGIRIIHIDKPDASSVWYPMTAMCVSCQRTMSPSVKYTTCGAPECIEFRNELYLQNYLREDKYKYWRWLFERSPKRKAKMNLYTQRYRYSNKGKATHAEYHRNMRMWAQVKLDYGL